MSQMGISGIVFVCGGVCVCVTLGVFGYTALVYIHRGY